MRFIHTADWHLGRVLHAARLTEDQAHVLDQLVDLARDARPHAVLVCGDIYDRAVPPPDAVALLDDALSRLVLDLKLPVICIAGNHDSVRRLEFGAKVLATRGLHLFGSLRDGVCAVTLPDESGPVHFYAMPFAEPSTVRESLGCEPLPDHDAAMRVVVDRIRAAHPRGERSVLLAHAFVQGGVESESERPLSVGGADKVDPSCFSGFDYVALGHLHRHQKIGTGRVRYSGSLLKYSFSEARDDKVVHIVEMESSGACTVESVRLTPRRDVRVISGFLRDVLHGPRPGENRDDYITVVLNDTGAILDVMGKLRAVYPNVLHVDRKAFLEVRQHGKLQADPRKLSDRDLFGDFFQEVTGSALTVDEASTYEAIVEEFRRRERETAPACDR